MPVYPIPTDQIVITASRAPQDEADTPASVSIIDSDTIQNLDEPLVSSLLRLTPSAAVSVSGPAGSLTEVRIRGSEANHTLLFIDGIRVNDPASGDAPRFELLNADLLSRIEVVRGPQSALWGSEAIGGVLALNGVDQPSGETLKAEAGSFGTLRASASGAVSSGPASVAGAIGFQRATGIDSFGAPGGDKDGYRNLSGRLRGTLQVAPAVRLGAAAIMLTGKSQFDGYDPVTFEHTDTRDSSSNRLTAGRLWADIGNESSPWSGRVGATLLDSSNRNLLAGQPVNRTQGTRRTLDAQIDHRFALGATDNRLILAAESERETFHARDVIYGGATDQDRNRSHNSVTAELRTSVGRFSADLAARRDAFNRFADATDVRASALLKLGGGFAVAGSFAQGIAQPTFFDLYGFFPNNFVGNPKLKPESSRGFEGSLRYRKDKLSASLTGYRQRLHDEIIDTFDPVIFLSSTANSSGVSHRWGVEAELGWQPSSALRISANYAFLHATQPSSTGTGQATELRRPKHSGAIVAEGAVGRWSYGASVSYSGPHLDREEVAPFGIVRVGAFWPIDARLSYSVRPGVDLYVRGSNLLDAKYEQVAGYHTEGIGGMVGLSLRAGPRSSR